MNLNLLKTFVKVAELGSFTKAAKLLNQPKSRVSRHIAILESDLGIELIRRTTRQINLTHGGKEFYQRVCGLLRELETQVDLMSDHHDEITGLIRLTAPEDIAQTILSKVIQNFEAKYPKVKFEVIVSNEYLDLTKENIDIAFRAGKLKDSNLKQKRLMETKIILVASKKYLQSYGRPSKLQDLNKHKLLAFTPIGFDKFATKDIHYEPFFSCDSFPMLLSMALDHKGIAILPAFYCQKQIEDGPLERVLVHETLRSSPLQLVFHSSKNMPQRIRLFIEGAIEFCSG
jgi:DNA-binding transcriptional LysR family regulator